MGVGAGRHSRSVHLPRFFKENLSPAGFCTSLLDIVNADPTIHNVHGLAKTHREFNFGQALQGMRTTRTFTAPEVMLPFKCDVHGWMYAYAGVVDHPYFAVSGADGAFSIANLPAGTYTLEAWHEKLGTQTQSVTVGAKETKPVSFTFKMG